MWLEWHAVKPLMLFEEPDMCYALWFATAGTTIPITSAESLIVTTSRAIRRPLWAIPVFPTDPEASSWSDVSRYYTDFPVRDWLYMTTDIFLSLQFSSDEWFQATKRNAYKFQRIKLRKVNSFFQEGKNLSREKWFHELFIYFMWILIEIQHENTRFSGIKTFPQNQQYSRRGWKENDHHRTLQDDRW